MMFYYLWCPLLQSGGTTGILTVYQVADNIYIDGQPHKPHNVCK